MILVARQPLSINYMVADRLVTHDDGTVSVVLSSGKFLSVNPGGDYSESDSAGPYERAVQTSRGLVYWSSYRGTHTLEWADGFVIAFEPKVPNAEVYDSEQ